MKLYTEEQVGYAFNQAKSVYDDGKFVYDSFDEIKFDGELTPIELPSDEEIFEIAPIDLGRGPSGIGVTGAFIMGAKWMRDKIQGGNK